MPSGTRLIAHSIYLSLLGASADAWLHRQYPYPTNSALLESKNAFSFEVSHDGRISKIEINQDESILGALERSGQIPDVQSDCRKGNCLTCAGMHEAGSQTSALLRGPDGLSPNVSKELEEKGHILLCSSYVTGCGLKLKLGTNHRAWDEMYRQRLEDDSTRAIGLEAVAKAMRLTSEANVEQWTQETETLLEKSGEL